MTTPDLPHHPPPAATAGSPAGLADDIPAARLVPHRRWSLQLVWLVPLVAALIGAWLALKAWQERGPTITVEFSTAEGLEAQKTRVKYRNLDIGRVTDLRFSDDSSRIVATLELTKQAAPFLVADTRFWVVRPRITGTQVSGLGTLFSGAYIGMDAGTSTESQREFVGLDVQPIVAVDRPGRHFTLRADDLGSLEVGSPIYFRRIEVGLIVAHQLDASGRGVTLNAFINAPYDRYVKADTRFWQASGFDVSLDANGLRLNAESLASVLTGGIAFQTPAESEADAVAPTHAEFTLYPDRSKALRLPDTAEVIYHVVFPESVRGLSVGAPVDFRGVVVGEVSAISVDFDPRTFDVRVPVALRLYPDRLRGKQGQSVDAASLIDKLVGRGLRAQLRNGSLLTGQLFVALDFFPDEAAARVTKRGGRSEMPAVAGSLQELQTTLLKVARKVDALPLDATVSDARDALQALQRTLAATERTMARIDAEVAPQAVATLTDLRRTLANTDVALRTIGSDEAPLQRDLRDTLREAARAAEALRNLADYLERHPDALLRGRREPTTP